MIHRYTGGQTWINETYDEFLLTLPIPAQDYKVFI